MVDFYVKMDESGAEIEGTRKIVGRGRHPLGFHRISEDGTIIANAPVPKQKPKEPKEPKEPKVKAKVKAKAKSALPEGYRYVRIKYNDDGDILDIKEMQRGKAPAGYVKAIMNDEDEIVDETEVQEETEIETTIHAQPLEQNPIIVEKSSTRPREITATKHPSSVEQFRSHFRVLDPTEDDDTLFWQGCAIPGPNEAGERIEDIICYFQIGMAMQLVKIDKNSGDISVFNSASEDEPDIIIRGAIQEFVPIDG